MPARLVGINRVALEVEDIDRSLAFFGRLFDVRLRGRMRGAAFVDMGDQFVALMQGRSQSADVTPHLGLVVDDKEAVQSCVRRGSPADDTYRRWGNAAQTACR